MAALVGGHEVRAGALLVAALDVVGQGFIDERLKLAALALGERAYLLQDIATF